MSKLMDNTQVAEGQKRDVMIWYRQSQRFFKWQRAKERYHAGSSHGRWGLDFSDLAYMIKYGYSEKWKNAETETWTIDFSGHERRETFGGLWGAPREPAWRCQICIALLLGPWYNKVIYQTSKTKPRIIIILKLLPIYFYFFSIYLLLLLSSEHAKRRGTGGQFLGQADDGNDWNHDWSTFPSCRDRSR